MEPKLKNQNTFSLICLVIVFTVLFTIVNGQGCGANCWKCDSTEVCTNCKMGFYLTKDYTCLPCLQGCSQCIHQQICMTCSQNYFRNSTSSLCQQCPDNCIECNYELGSVRCSNCASGSYLSNLNTQCLPCLQFCAQCVSASSCTLCSAGFGYDSTQKRCIACSQNCITCEPGQDVNETVIPMACTHCETGYFVDQNSDYECKECVQNCKTCTNSTNCQLCLDNYYIQTATEDSSSYQQCTRCPDQNCVTCLTTYPQKCTKCQQGYYSQGSSQSQAIQCVKCTDNCHLCLSASVCQSCISGYYMTQSNSCQPCGTACQICTGTGNCTACQGAYYLAQGVCQPCDYGCAQCTAKGQCQTCISLQYGLEEGKCKSCQQFMWECNTCLNTSYCVSCNNNNYLYNGECINTNNGMSTWGIVLIILSIAIVIGALVFAIIKKREADSLERQANRGGAYLQIQ